MVARFADFAAVLHANAPNPEHAEALQLYGRFVGNWDSEIIAHGPDGSCHRALGEIHFGWILEGRAIQDVWMIPRLADRDRCATLSDRRQLVRHDDPRLRPNHPGVAHLLD